jgi:hypothetical protein
MKAEKRSVIAATEKQSLGNSHGEEPFPVKFISGNKNKKP